MPSTRRCRSRRPSAGRPPGGTGSAWAAAGGVLLGGLLVGVVAPSGQPELIVPVALTLPLFGVLGYELSDSGPAGLTPVVGLTAHGGNLGLQGAF